MSPARDENRLAELASSDSLNLQSFDCSLMLTGEPRSQKKSITTTSSVCSAPTGIIRANPVQNSSHSGHMLMQLPASCRMKLLNKVYSFCLIKIHQILQVNRLFSHSNIVNTGKKCD